VSIGIPKEVAFADVNRILARNLAGLGLVAVLALAAAWFGGDLFVLRRVRALLRATKRLGAGDLGARTGLTYGQGELDQLARAFDEMAESLEQRDAQLRAAEADRRANEEEIGRQREALLQREKLAAMGELLAGVAHELNNPLSVVTGQAALLRQIAGEGPLAVRAEKISQAAERCARIVKNFLALARQRPPERQRVQLNRVIREAVELVAYPLKVDNVEVSFDLSDDLPVLWADPYQLQQVVVNLITNAHHAMRETPPPRRLTLTSRFDPDQGRVSLEVADTGPGISPAIRDRIFEPFFTTKPSGQGTGLGLSLCQGIVEGHGGSIGVESEASKGAAFRIELPVGAVPAAEAEVRAGEEIQPIAGKAILVVDDEPEVAGVLTDLLSADGHQVETAANGMIAIDKLRERSYDLIVSDLKMPELDGPGLYLEVKRRHPDLIRRFVFVTGDILGPETRAFLDETGAPNLSKPFAFEMVRRVIQQVLQSPQRGRP
jgi:signal transduction histidine kinase/CheY-like chemotaxis protein